MAHNIRGIYLFNYLYDKLIYMNIAMKRLMCGMMVFSVINIIYWLYEMSIYISVNIIYSYELEEQQDQIYKEVIGYCNNFCNEISYDIVWKYCEAITITKTLYRKNIVPNFHYLTTDYFRYPILLIKDGKEEKYFKNIKS